MLLWLSRNPTLSLTGLCTEFSITSVEIYRYKKALFSMPLQRITMRRNRHGLLHTTLAASFSLQFSSVSD
jgi:hypothetical protein